MLVNSELHLSGRLREINFQFKKKREIDYNVFSKVSFPKNYKSICETGIPLVSGSNTVYDVRVYSSAMFSPGCRVLQILNNN